MLTLLALACSESETPSGDAVERGRTIYNNICITCHAADPRQDGSVGPAIAGSSRELIEARVLRGQYPPGYTPKRASQAMPVFPFLKDNIDDLAAYLAEAAKP
jgi:mono/diheme cytochrome c family protein